ncbi:MAG: GbsR/MarR family transcriptional regulator [Halobacteriaceae archaeon]
MNKPRTNTASDDNAVDEAQEEVIEAMERSAELYGLKRSYGRLYGILLFAENPLSLDGLVSRSGYAKSTVSDAMQQMETLYLVQRRSIPGEGKKAYYEAQTDFWHITQQVLQHQVQREIDIMTQALTSAENRLESKDNEQAISTLQTIQSLKSTYERFDRLVTLLTNDSVNRFKSLIDRLQN